MKFLLRIILIICIIISHNFYSQKFNIEPVIKVSYESTLKLGEKFRKKQSFILVGNSTEYYFAGYQNYLNDFKKYKESGVDLQAISDYFQERIIKTSTDLNVFYSRADVNIYYSEDVPLKWVLYSDTKIIAGVKCQKAATNAFGRRWIAYFSKEYKQNIGPYKFNGLPGLVFEVFDTRDDYHFTLSKIEKFSEKLVFNERKFKLFPKSKYLKAKFSLDFEGAAFPPMYGDMKREYDETTTALKKMFNNPIEIQP